MRGAAGWDVSVPAHQGEKGSWLLRERQKVCLARGRNQGSSNKKMRTGRENVVQTEDAPCTEKQQACGLVDVCLYKGL